MNTRDYVDRLLELGRHHGELPIYGSPAWEALPVADPRRFASVVRAAEAWRLDGTPEAIQQRLDEDQLIVRHRTRTTGLDVHEAHMEKKGGMS